LVVEHFKQDNIVTFTKTTSFTRLTASPYQPKGDRPDDKYKGGKGSVKGLHYLRFIGLELISENAFTLTFHKFFSNEVKNLIRSIEQCKFSPELRAWVLPTTKYDQLMEDLQKICLVNNIHIEDIPSFTMQLMNCKIPNHPGYDYLKDDQRLRLEEFLPQFICESLYPI